MKDTGSRIRHQIRGNCWENWIMTYNVEIAIYFSSNRAAFKGGQLSDKIAKNI